MKFQYLAVIFVIIMLPIVLVLSFYTQTQIDILNRQSNYTSILNDATYAAVKAFQINTTNSYYSSVSDSKIRDIEASVNTFYSSLNENLNYTKEELQTFTPAIVFTLYDGYYIYGKRYNVLNNNDIEKDTTTDEIKGYKIQIIDETGSTTDPNRYEYGLKPFVYYSCRYAIGSNEFVINFTLDNFISIYGIINCPIEDENGNEIPGSKTPHYVTKSGYLINPDSWDGTNYKGAAISKNEYLDEYLMFSDGSSGIYKYVIYKNQKIYIDDTGTPKYFWFNQGSKNEINSTEIIEDIKSKQTTSAKEYYDNAKKFSEWVNTYIGNTTQENIKLSGNHELEFDAGTSKIFELSNNNDPEDVASTFNEHRIAVIKNTIETNLIAAFNSHNSFASSVEYALPKLKEEDWEKIVNNVCIVSFMQGLPTGGKYFNSYSVIPNDINDEFVDDDALYLLTEDGQYHLPNCELLVENKDNLQDKILVADKGTGYLNTSFAQQTIKVDSKENRYYKHIYNGNQPYTGCYHCIVNGTSKYELQDILNATNNKIKGKDITNLRSKYLTALAREKYNLYKTNN